MDKYQSSDRQDLNTLTNFKNAIENVCICCNQTKNDLVQLSECNFAYIIERLVDFKLSKRNKMCDLCHLMLKKIYRFTKQIEENYGLLNPYMLAGSKWYSLVRSDIVIVDTSLEQLEHKEVKVENGIKIEDSEVKIEYINIEEQTETQESQDFESEIFKNVTEDTDEFSALKNDYNLEHTSIDNLDNVTDKVKKKKPRTELQANYSGKIRILNITVEEVMKEREVERNNEKYLSWPYKCEDCIIAYKFEDSLKRHMMNSHTLQENGITCPICKAVSASKRSYERHHKRHLRRYECMACGKRTVTIYPLLNHYKEIHGVVPHLFKCKLCDFTTDAYRVFRYHREKHVWSRARCTICDKSFVNVDVLRCHIRLIHNDRSQKTFPCDVCGKIYTRIQSLRKHHLSHKPSNHFCATCQMTFKTKEILKTHLKRHSRHINDDDKRYTCNECGDKFVLKRTLEDHISFDHLKIYKHSCDTCSKVLKSQRNLARHKKFVHDKVQPPKNKICDHCGRAFATLAVLRCHIRTHTGERPLKCPECPATFAQSAALYTHKKCLHKAKRQTNK